MQVAQEIQQLVNEARKAPTKLIFKKIHTVQHWQDMVVVIKHITTARTVDPPKYLSRSLEDQNIFKDGLARSR